MQLVADRLYLGRARWRSARTVAGGGVLVVLGLPRRALLASGDAEPDGHASDASFEFSLPMKVFRSKPGASRAEELQDVTRVERVGLPFLVLRDGAGTQRLAVLEAGDERGWIGRGPDCDIVLDWDDQVSRVHAELLRVAGEWAVVDDGLSRNGTFVGGERVLGRRRLYDAEPVVVGNTVLVYRAPRSRGRSTSRAGDRPAPELSPMQRKVLSVLCRPLVEQAQPAVPATNREIAEELVLSVDAVKTHMRALFERFALSDLPQNQKRARLAELALRSGSVPGRERRP